MKYKGRKIAGSSLLMILGVVCFATMLVAAVTLSAIVSTTSKNINAEEIGLSLIGGTSVGEGTAWSSVDPAFGSTGYYQPVVATMNGYSGNYYMKIVVKVGGTPTNSSAWLFTQKIAAGTSAAMTWNVGMNAWYSTAALTSTEVQLAFSFTTPASSQTAVTIDFQAVSGTGL